MQLGNCFQHAATKVLYDLDHTYTLVHGIPTGQGKIEGVQYGHAWVEYMTDCGIEMVYDTERNVTLPKCMYYGVGKIEYTVRYTRAETINMMREYGHGGPWDEKIEEVTEQALTWFEQNRTA